MVKGSSMGKRIRNYRSGDRAEDLGIFLLKALCAVAPIPRQEDFGLADAVATLLRPEGRFWYAEDSFLVQFKSRTERNLELKGPVFQRWLEQDLSVLVGRINLVENTLELFTLGTALFDRRLHDAKGLIVWLTEGKDGLHDGVLNLNLDTPILNWSVADTEDSEAVERTYAVLKEWLRLERWNRRYFRAGVAREILWETNQTPEIGEIIHTWTPAHGREALSDIEPLVQLLGMHARHHPEFWTRVHEIEEALRGPNDSGPLTGIRSFLRLTDVMSRLAEIAEKHPIADTVVTIQILRIDSEGANFWIHSYGRSGPGGSTRLEGTWETLKGEGVDSEIRGDGQVTLHLDRFFRDKPTPHAIIEGPTESPVLGRGDHSPCYFLRRIAPARAEQ